MTALWTGLTLWLVLASSPALAPAEAAPGFWAFWAVSRIFWRSVPCAPCRTRKAAEKP